MDSDSTLGASTGSVLNITGVISNQSNTVENLTKEGAGKIIFSTDNTYAGLTTINNGILTIRTPFGLGTQGTAASGTIVNHTLTKTGTLQLEEADPTQTGFLVQG